MDSTPHNSAGPLTPASSGDAMGGAPTHAEVLGVVVAERDAALASIERLRAFARNCVEHGDMTPMAARMLNRILDGEK